MPRKLEPDVKKTGQRFSVPLNLRVDGLTGTVIPVETSAAADFRCTLLLEYPTYEEELRIKQNCQVIDDYGTRLDWDRFVEARVRRCLIRWDLHERIPNFTEKLLRLNDSLDDDSLRLWKELPPLVRKEIIRLVNENMGAP
jgi:hypothetical protein